MRIIAGKYRSRPLVAPQGMDTRPTTDRLRETLFNVLAPRIEGSTLLDLYAGSGAVGLEALSRGAAKIHFVENAKQALRSLEKNIAALSIPEEQVEIQAREVAKALPVLAAAGVRCDICYLDPPYQQHGAYARTLEFLSQTSLLAGGAIVIAEHDKHFSPAAEFGPLVRYRELKQGDGVLSFYRLEDIAEQS
jgi:16S rRNA (guanine966-N2)-methyltransferase